MKRARMWIGVFILLFLGSLMSLILMSRNHQEDHIAKIYSEGQCIEVIDLNQVKESREWVVETALGRNRIRVEQGRIRVVEASCKDHICVDMGWISDGTLPIVCLPNQLTIQLEGTKEGKLDGVSQ